MTPMDPDTKSNQERHGRPLFEVGASDPAEPLAELTARVRELELERDALRDFAAGAAHELVAPLVMIEAYSTMAPLNLDPAAHREARLDVEAIGRIAARARLLVEALLAEAVARDEPLSLRPVDLATVLADVEHTVAPELAAQDAVVESGELPTVPGEPALLRAVFMNLVVNALRYAPRGNVRLRVGAWRGPAGHWTVAVDSNGPTVSTTDRERIFEPYQRGQGERRTRGAGLGLAICRRIVERHGGEIGVAPRNDGNRFWFTLPE